MAIAGYPSSGFSGRNFSVAEVNGTACVYRPSGKKGGERSLKHFGKAGGYFVAAVLLNRLPARTMAGVQRTLVPVDWKAWAKIILGIMATNAGNRAFNFAPPPWLNGIEAVAVITAITQGVNRTAFKQFALIAPLVALVVQGAVFLNQKFDQSLKERFNVPPLATQLAISTTSIVLGAFASHRLLKSVGLGATGALAASTCARGCSPGSMICLSEAGEMLGALKNWFHQRWGKRSEPVNPT